ncbi:type IX secretion system membrane protein PorP/SprF [Flavobacterium sp. Sd200]|uniref:PorP/SprF family type IX secretion system membrane protein n=1 Tax=Flavobacterium sp. Sd200 TaxID=2692211 RepID=UPI00137187B4|nr:type IX secretion system membrane protein PorP/SprF [Flavobacterium sp. Sd200]MXN89834.1 type IX secretion system membrane protein PorP/SprF [Flavobacterium sp. Sd200]
MKGLFAFTKKYLVLLLLLWAINLEAQQDPQYTQYMYNTLTINPGYTGSTGGIEANLLHRSQWIGIDGAPRTQSFSIHSPYSQLYEHIGIGLSVVNDRIGPSDEVYVDGNFSYTILTGAEGKLAFGLKAGARVLNTDWSRGRYYQEGDPLLNNNINNRIAPALGAGIYYYTNNWYAGVSVPNFVRTNIYDDVKESIVSDRLHYYAIAGYVFNFSDNLKFKPAVMAKVVNGAPITVDASANFLIQETVTLGAAYRWNDAVSALAGVQVTENIFVAYSYDYSVTELNKYNNGTHEFMIRFQLLPKANRIRSPRFF